MIDMIDDLKSFAQNALLETSGKDEGAGTPFRSSPSLVEPIPLRFHHFACLPLYIGRGYSPRFTEVCQDAICQVHRKVPVLIVDGWDRLCHAPCPNKLQGPCKLAYAVRDRDEAARDVLVHYLSHMQDWRYGATVHLDAALTEQLRSLYRCGPLQKTCARCPWHGLCRKTAECHFANARLFPFCHGRKPIYDTLGASCFA